MRLRTVWGLHYRQSRNSGEQKKAGDCLYSAEMGSPTGKGKPLNLSLNFQDNKGSANIQTSQIIAVGTHPGCHFVSNAPDTEQIVAAKALSLSLSLCPSLCSLGSLFLSLSLSLPPLSLSLSPSLPFSSSPISANVGACARVSLCVCVCVRACVRTCGLTC
jgi:hypothetical protein